jgi:copper(I)-binding protein
MMGRPFSAACCMAAVLACCTVLADSPPAQKVTIHDAWARATAPGMTMGAVYVTLRGGTQPDRLLAAKTTRAATTQIHVVTTQDGMMQMRETDAIEVPAGARVTFSPQGMHLMLVDLTQPLVAGERFPLSLRFAQAGTLVVSVRVVAPGDEPVTAH